MDALSIRYNCAIKRDEDIDHLKCMDVDYENVEETKECLAQYGCPSTMAKWYSGNCEGHGNCRKCWEIKEVISTNFKWKP